MIKKSILRIAVIIFLLALWAVGDWFGLFNPVVFPPLNEVGSALLMILDRPEFSSAFMATLLDSMKGVIYAAVIAIPSGIIIGMYPSVEKATRILLDFGRSFPVVALMPIFVLIIGATSQMKVVMVSIAWFFPILLQTIYGARRLEPTIIDTITAYVFGRENYQAANRWIMSIQAIILAFAIMFMATILDMTGSLDLAYQIMIGLMIVVVITVLMLGRTPDYDRARLATTSSR
jgi:ABC-type nitrate/sulfonate/bicarbonate transport system permease component